MGTACEGRESRDPGNKGLEKHVMTVMSTLLRKNAERNKSSVK